jgi:hypothetical protein
MALPRSDRPASSRASATSRTEFKASGSRGPEPSPISHDRIAQRAYEIYAKRGYSTGNPNDDWLEAERQLRAGM